MNTSLTGFDNWWGEFGDHLRFFDGIIKHDLEKEQ